MGNEHLDYSFRFGRLVSSVAFPKKSFAAIGVGLVLLLFLLGCDFRKIVVNDPIHPEDVAFIKSGKTTMQQVTARLGAPDEITGTPDRLWFRYHFKTTKILRVDFGVLFRIWSPVSPPMSIGRSDAGTDVFLVAFDSQWVTRDLRFPPPKETGKVNFWPF